VPDVSRPRNNHRHHRVTIKASSKACGIASELGKRPINLRIGVARTARQFCPCAANIGLTLAALSASIARACRHVSTWAGRALPDATALGDAPTLRANLAITPPIAASRLSE
jgi:hypothetical protein